jgi:hypothetical protein
VTRHERADVVERLAVSVRGVREVRPRSLVAREYLGSGLISNGLRLIVSQPLRLHARQKRLRDSVERIDRRVLGRRRWCRRLAPACRRLAPALVGVGDQHRLTAALGLLVGARADYAVIDSSASHCLLSGTDFTPGRHSR